MNFEQHTPAANKFVHELADLLERNHDTDHAYRVLRSVLHALRQVITPEESLHLISQLPLIIKGVYVDGWHLSAKPKIKTTSAFLSLIREQNPSMTARDFGNDETAKHYVHCVFDLLKHHVTMEEIQHIIDQFPMELSELWLTTEKK